LSAWFRHCPGRAWVVPVATGCLLAAPDGRVAGGGGCGRHCLAAAAVRGRRVRRTTGPCHGSYRRRRGQQAAGDRA